MLADVRAFVEDQGTDYSNEHGTIDAGHDWPHPRTFVHVISKRMKGDKASHSKSIYLFSNASGL